MYCKPAIFAPLALQSIAQSPCTHPANGRAIYMLSNEHKNAVLALPIGRDGLFAPATGTLTATGGAGMNGLNSSHQPSFPDALFSQSSVTIAGNNLFAVNPGSDTVSMFAIDRRDPTKLTLVGEPAAVPGEFPVTVAVSAQHRLVCVGTSGAVAGVSCARFSAQGIDAMDDIRIIDIGQTTPPVGPANTLSHVFFSGDESTVFATVKSNGESSQAGLIAAFPVAASPHCGSGVSVGRQGLLSSLAGTALLFGSSTIPGSNDLFVTDASFGAVVLTNGDADPADAAFRVKGKGVIDGQLATCWVAVSTATRTAFVTDNFVDWLVEMSLEDAGVKSIVRLGPNGGLGLIDLRAAGRFVYALSPGDGAAPAAVKVVDVVARREVQHFRLEGIDFGKNSQGMALLM
ncbi:hypothetical protein F4802DRAFT_401013 [Xylaria palmicola]|nr:hypothetical protein F4802DRAFT_401013 [Xylaria palmicola]